METSPSIAALAKALAAFQSEATNPPKTRTAKVPTKSGGEYKYNYADLSDIITAVKANLRKHGLSVVQSAVSDGNGIGVQTMLTHESGEWIKSDPLILPLQAATPQAAGSAVTYARRYALSAILGISTEEDDDAGVAQDHATRTTAAPKAAPNTAPKAAPKTQRPAATAAQSGEVTLPFGKHKGKPLHDLSVPFDYLEWMANTKLDDKALADLEWGAINTKLRDAIVAELARRQFDQTSELGTEVADDGPFGGDAA